MIDTKSMEEFMTDTLPNLLGLGDQLIQHFHMTGKTDTGSGDIPGVKIMDTAYAGDLLQETLDLLKIQSFRGGIHKNPAGRFENRPAVFQDEKHDKNGKQGVQPVPGPEDEDSPVDQHHDRSQEITYHVEEGAPDIEAVL